MNKKTHTATNTPGIIIVVHADEGFKGRGILRDMGQELTVGVGTEAVNELPRADFYGRLHARLPEA